MSEKENNLMSEYTDENGLYVPLGESVDRTNTQHEYAVIKDIKDVNMNVEEYSAAEDEFAKLNLSDENCRLQQQFDGEKRQKIEELYKNTVFLPIIPSM